MSFYLKEDQPVAEAIGWIEGKKEHGLTGLSLERIVEHEFNYSDSGPLRSPR